MAYGIGQTQKLGKQNRKRLDNTTDPYSAPSTPSYRYDKLNENTDIPSKKSLTSQTHSRKIFSIEDKPSDIIRNNSAANPYSKDMFIKNISVHNDAQSFEITRKIIIVSLHQGTLFWWFFIMLGRLRIPE